jgi:hypothetical protein
MVIGGAGRNLMVGGFGVDRGESSVTVLANSGELGASVTGATEASATRATITHHLDTIAADTAVQFAEEAASRDGVLWSALTGQSGEAFDDIAEAMALDQFFGSAGLDLGAILEGEGS